MCKYIGTVRFLTAQLIYNKRGIRQKCLHRSKEFSFTSKCSGRSDLSLPQSDQGGSRTVSTLQSTFFTVVTQDKLKLRKVLKSLCCHYTVQKLLYDQCAVNFLEVLKVY